MTIPDKILLNKTKTNEVFVAHPSLFHFLKENKLSQFSFAVLLHVNINYWEQKIGKGYFCCVYNNIEKATELEHKYYKENTPSESRRADIAVEIKVILSTHNQLIYRVSPQNTGVFDIITCDEFIRITPFPDKPRRNSDDESDLDELHSQMKNMNLDEISERTLYIIAKAEKHFINDLKEKIDEYENKYSISSIELTTKFDFSDPVIVEKFSPWKNIVDELTKRIEKYSLISKFLSRIGIYIV